MSILMTTNVLHLSFGTTKANMYRRYNPNPLHNRVGDCAVRAIAKALDISWDEAYVQIAIQGFIDKDMPNGNDVWGAFLIRKGFRRRAIPETCSECYTIIDFCKDHPQGVYVVGTGSHVLAVVNGQYFDSWDSGDELPIYFYYKGE